MQEGTEGQLARLQVASGTWVKAAACREERASGHSHSHPSLAQCCSVQSFDITVGSVVEPLPPQDLQVRVCQYF